MAEDVGGSPYSDGADHGDADDEFATVVLDEAFIRSAAVYEPSAKERQLAAAEARSEPEPGIAVRPVEYGADRLDGLPLELRPHPAGLEDDRIYTDPWVGAGRRPGRRRAVRWPGYGPRAQVRGQVAQQRWHRPLAWVLVIVMGVSLVAVAVAAVYRGSGSAPGRRPEVGTSRSADPAPAPPAADASARPGAAAVPLPTG
ncbi:hypothetical protein OG455_26490 [Kitasatospora sp. NBC_01287]|uniref:SCO2584 family spore wall biosynthesis protein n=1 Tax=Kitasatospora sp. NBC_01287 TaxID=2903573 RepID=UPI00225A67E7|nr:hypothetical protein [Kitasatospora sp. NBC_01287]MCX4749017.1 hypothetical protein [Kitasatospora sp. NBC_01287]